MTKQEFLSALGNRLSGIPKKELGEALAYYEEMLDDRIEDGMSEQNAVATIGTPDDVAKQVIASIPMGKLARERIKPKRRLRTWEIVLLAVGSPVWAPIAIALLAVFLSLYIVLWALVAVVWAVGAAFAVCGVAGIVATVPALFHGNIGLALFYLGAGLALAGLSIFTYYGALAATRGTLRLSKAIWQATKRALVRKEKTA